MMASKKKTTAPAKRIKSAVHADNIPEVEKVKLVKEAIQGILQERNKERGSTSNFFNSSGSSPRSVYKGARKNQYNEDWFISPETADYEHADSLTELRYRCRQSVKDNGIAEGTVVTYDGMIVGEGPSITSKAKDPAAQEQIQFYINGWRKRSDITGEFSLTDQNSHIIHSACTDGDVLVSLPLDRGANVSTIQTRVQLIEADRITTPRKFKTSKEGRVRNGVAYDKGGRVVGYWVRKLGISETEHKYGYNLSTGIENYNYMPKYKNGRMVTWLFRRPGGLIRPGQSRQVPLFASCLTLMKDIEDLLDAHIVGTRAASCIMAFLKSNNPEGLLDSLLTDTDTETRLEDRYGQGYTKIQPASIIPLRTGEEMQFLDPHRNNNDIEPLIVRLASLIAMKVRVPYPILFLDLAQINYSSYRGGILESRRVFRRYRRDLSDSFIAPVMSTVITEAWLKGLLPAVKELTPDVLFPRITFPAWGYVDQQKETKSEFEGIEHGLTSHMQVADEHNQNWEETLEEEIIYRKRKKELEEKHGLTSEPEQGADNADRE